MRSTELQVIPTLVQTHTCARACIRDGLRECVKQCTTPTEYYYQCCALLMVMLCEVRSCSTQTPAAAAAAAAPYSHGTARHQRIISWFLLYSDTHFTFCLFLQITSLYNCGILLYLST